MISYNENCLNFLSFLDKSLISLLTMRDSAVILYVRRRGAGRPACRSSTCSPTHVLIRIRGLTFF